MVFPNPDFAHDENSNQYLFFRKFIKMLNRNYIALSEAEHQQMLDFVSDCCEAFYRQVRHSKKIARMDSDQIESLETELRHYVA